MSSTIEAIRRAYESGTALDLADRFMLTRTYEKAAAGAPVGRSGEELLTAAEFAETIRTRATVTSPGVIPWGTPPDEAAVKPSPGGLLAPLVRVVATTTSAIQVGEEGTKTQVAQAQPFGTAAQESAMSFTAALPQSQWIAVWVQVTRSAWADRGVVAAVLDQLVTEDVGRQIDVAVWNEITGAPLPTQALGTDNRVTALVKAATQIRKAEFGREGVTVAIHPSDAQDLVTDPGFDAAALAKLDLVGVRGFVLSTLVAQGSPIVGDYQRGATLYVTQPVTVTTADSHADYFVTGKLAVLADTRVSPRLHFPAAFCEVTGF